MKRLKRALNQSEDLKDVALEERRLEFLYLEGKELLVSSILTDLEQMLIPFGQSSEIKTNYLKEGVGTQRHLFRR